MKKSNPSKICTDFQEEINRLKNFLDESYSLYESSDSQDRHQSEICELVFYRAYVEFEAFLSDYFVAAINRKHLKFYASEQERVRQSVKERYGAFLKDKLSFEKINNLTVRQVESLIDSKGRNLTFDSCEEIRNKAQCWLDSSFYSKVNGVDNCSIVILDAARSIRNCIAHKSKSSFTEMNAKLKGLDQSVCNNQLNKKINSTKNIGAYLKVKISTGKRIDEYFNAFTSYANHLK